MGIGSASAPLVARGLLYGSVVRHSMMLAFLDDFRALAIVFLMTLPFVYFLKAGVPGKSAPPAH
jgi:DHA2 family multidrug resistance protein